MKKVISVILALALCLTLSSLCFAQDGEINYLVLGDSITEGYGVKNSGEACYGRIVADTNGWNFYSEARAARDSSDLLYLLENSSYTRRVVGLADVISLSIGANDYFANPDVVSLVIGALFHLNGKTLDKIADGYYENLCKIIDEIDKLNPGAQIFIQKYYHVWTGIASTAWDACCNRVEMKIDEYIENHPGRVTLLEISPAIEGHPEYIADDCVHPNAKGNVAIAAVVEESFAAAGLCENKEPVINAEGEDWNYYTEEIDKTFGPALTVIVKTVTGLSCNIIR